MNTLDVVTLVATVTAATAAWRLGFVARALSWIGLLAGAYVAARLSPALLDRMEGASQVQAFFVVTAALVGGGFLGQAAGLVLGGRLRVAIPEGARRTDQTLGALAGAAGVLAMLWLLLPAMATVPGWPAEQARNSSIARGLSAVLPPPPDTFAALDRVIGDDRFPEVFDALRPAPDLGRPPAATGIDAAVARQVTDSVVRVEGVACDRLQEGSGFVVATDLVATNAHVVAGTSSLEVVRTDGARVAAVVVAFDPDADLALLAVPGIDRPPLPVGDADVGARGGVWGFPGGGDLRIAPFEVGQELRARGRDIYDGATTVREILVLSASLAPGDSGSAVVDRAGRVVGVAFAIAPDRPSVAYALTDDELEEVLARPRSGAVETGRCL